MALLNNEVKVIEQSKVSPPIGSVPTTSLPFTFFDVPWFLCPHIKRLYFYEFPYSTHHFLETLLPSLKNSLSLALQHFFPFAANLACPPPPAKPRILFTDGGSVSLTVAESAADFHFLCANHPRPGRSLHPFVPELGPARVEGGTRVSPLLALQVTVFPNSGICVGVRFCHAVADGKAFHHFMKSWALVCKSGGDFDHPDLRMPSHDRAAVKDPDGLELLFLEQYRSLASTLNDHEDAGLAVLDCRAVNVRATFVLRQVQIERIRRWVTNQLVANNENSSTPFYLSSFVVTCALIWVCLSRSEERNSTINANEEKEGEEPYYFIFPADCRSRLEVPLPATYFGNCLTSCFVPLKRKELLGENGISTAAKAIGNEVGRLESEALKEMEKWLIKWKQAAAKGQYVTVAGSTNLGVYEEDFGWGRPKKSESVHIEGSSAFSIGESRDERGGAEVGLALSNDRMSRFSVILEEKLNEFS